MTPLVCAAEVFLPSFLQQTPRSVSGLDPFTSDSRHHSPPPTNCCLWSMEKEAKKEAFRKYLESNGVFDVLTKVLVALYEENDKPSSPIEFVQQKLGGPTLSEYEKLQAEKADLQMKYDKLLVAHKDTCKEIEELRGSSKEMTDKDES